MEHEITRRLVSWGEWWRHEEISHETMGWNSETTLSRIIRQGVFVDTDTKRDLAKEVGETNLEAVQVEMLVQNMANRCGFKTQARALRLKYLEEKAEREGAKLMGISRAEFVIYLREARALLVGALFSPAPQMKLNSNICHIQY